MFIQHILKCYTHKDLSHSTNTATVLEKSKGEVLGANVYLPVYCMFWFVDNLAHGIFW